MDLRVINRQSQRLCRGNSRRREKRRRLVKRVAAIVLVLSGVMLGMRLYVFWQKLFAVPAREPRKADLNDPVAQFLALRAEAWDNGLPLLYVVLFLSALAFVLTGIILAIVCKKPENARPPKEIDYKALRERVREYRSHHSQP